MRCHFGMRRPGYRAAEWLGPDSTPEDRSTSIPVNSPIRPPFLPPRHSADPID